jgi:hypothetical protein
MESFTNYEDFKRDIPQNVREHLEGLAKDTKLPQTEATISKLGEAWLLKRALFYKMAEHENFQRTATMAKTNKNGCIAITLSGSIVSIGPLVNDNREIKYTSIGMRLDVPESLYVRDGRLAEDIVCGKPIVFRQGALEKTSLIMDLAISPENKNEKEQKATLTKVDKKLRADFVQVNKDALETESKKDVLKIRNDLFRKWIIIQWFIIGGMEKHIFMARAKILWLELFTKIYNSVSKKIKNTEQRDNAFLDFTNKRFAKFIDDYKWYESEQKNFDIGLMKALEELPEYQAYVIFADDFCAG